MQIFGYFYYKFSRPYRKWEGNYYYQMPIILLSMCQTFNVLALIPLLFKVNSCNWTYCIFFSFFLLFNLNIFLNSNKRERYEQKWIKQSKIKRVFGSFLAIAYIIFSFITLWLTMQFYLDDIGWDWNLNCSWRWW